MNKKKLKMSWTLLLHNVSGCMVLAKLQAEHRNDNHVTINTTKKKNLMHSISQQ